MRAYVLLLIAASLLLNSHVLALRLREHTGDWELFAQVIEADLGQQPLQQQAGVASGNPISANDDGCLGGDRRHFVTQDGEFFLLRCGYRVQTTAIQNVPAPSISDCVKKCAEEVDCRSALFDTSASVCVLQSQGPEASDADKDANYHYAYIIEPPTYQSDNEKLIACSTTCPSANGQSYKSVFGPSFRISCGKRHATPYLETRMYGSFADCMDACAADTRCTSVDYRARDKKCYFSTHLGEPKTSTPGFSSAYSLGCTGACSAGNGTGPVAPEPLCPPMPDASCNNEGLAYAVYPCPYEKHGFLKFDPTPLKRGWPLYTTGTTLRIGFADTRAPGALYGYTPPSHQNISVNHRGYFFAQASGVYTFRAPRSNDVTMLWLGDKAVRGWTRGNADLDQIWEGSTKVRVSFDARLERGRYYPLRIVWANAVGEGNMKITVTAPDGSVVVSDEPSPYFVRYSCDETTAPRFPTFGNET